MPQPEVGSSFRGLFRFSVMGTGGTVGPNTYLDASLPIPRLPELGLSNVQALVNAPAVQQAGPSLFVSYVYRIDATHLGVRWFNTTGGSINIPAAEYDVTVIA
jgi:hypothetical protein